MLPHGPSLFFNTLGRSKSFYIHYFQTVLSIAITYDYLKPMSVANVRFGENKYVIIIIIISYCTVKSFPFRHLPQKYDCIW